MLEKKVKWKMFGRLKIQGRSIDGFKDGLIVGCGAEPVGQVVSMCLYIDNGCYRRLGCKISENQGENAF